MYIVIEGVEGAGKSTAMSVIQDKLKNLFAEKNILQTREPGGTVLAEGIRTLFKSEHKEKVSARTEMLLMYAAREQLLANVVKPALDSGSIVVSDRSFYSSLAYQGAILKENGDTANYELLLDLSKGVIKPDLAIFLHVDSETSRKRVLSRGEAIDRIEKRKNEFFDKANAEFVGIFTGEFASHDPRSAFNSIKNGNAIVIDANQSLENVTKDIESQFCDWLFKANYSSRKNCCNN